MEGFKFFKRQDRFIMGTDRSGDRLKLTNLRESRRKVLAILGVAGAGGTVLIAAQKRNHARDRKHLTRTENLFADAAVEVNDAQLSDPKVGPSRLKSISNALESATETLNREFSDNPQTQRRASVIADVEQYYRKLNEILRSLTQLRYDVEQSESSTLRSPQADEEDPTKIIDRYESELDIRALSETYPSSIEATTGDNQLLPDQEFVTNSLQDRYEVLKQHLSMQQIYRETSAIIDRGIRRLEEGQVTKARSEFEEALTLLEEIPQPKHNYRLWSEGMSLREYRRLFDRRQEGIQIAHSASESAADNTRQLNQAIDEFFEAREVAMA